MPKVIRASHTAAESWVWRFIPVESLTCVSSKTVCNIEQLSSRKRARFKRKNFVCIWFLHINPVETVVESRRNPYLWGDDSFVARGATPSASSYRCGYLGPYEWHLHCLVFWDLVRIVRALCPITFYNPKKQQALCGISSWYLRSPSCISIGSIEPTLESDPFEVALQHTSLAWVAAAPEIWTPLLASAQLAVAPMAQKGGLHGLRCKMLQVIAEISFTSKDWESSTNREEMRRASRRFLWNLKTAKSDSSQADFRICRSQRFGNSCNHPRFVPPWVGSIWPRHGNRPSKCAAKSGFIFRGSKWLTDWTWLNWLTFFEDFEWLRMGLYSILLRCSFSRSIQASSDRHLVSFAEASFAKRSTLQQYVPSALQVLECCQQRLFWLQPFLLNEDQNLG